MDLSLINLWRQVRDARDFEASVDLIARDLAEAFTPVPLRAIAILRDAGDVRAVHTVPLADPRTLDGTAACAAWRSVEDDPSPFVLGTSRATGTTSLTATDETREGLLDRNTRHLVVCPLFARRGLLVWEFAEPLVAWTEAATAACILSAWMPPREAPVLGGPYVDRFLPVAGPSLSRVLHMLERFARQEEPVLLQGETGVGKTRLAQWVHARSRRAAGPVVVVNLLTIDENLRAARLFGTRRGAFTGAIEMTGAVARAKGGTLFIDEIDKLPLATQAQLLQLLDDGSFQSLGAEASEHADLRIVTGTNVDLVEHVRAGTFLHDLHRRVAVFPVRIPPLRERREDISPWATWFLTEHARKTGVQLALGADACSHLERLPWPGNLRQLNAIVVRAAALAPDPSMASLDAGAIQRAVALDPETASPLLDAMGATAGAFVDLCEGRDDLALEHLRSLRGMVLSLAIERHGKREALRMLGESKRLEGDNHHRFLRDEQEHVARLRQALAQGVDGDPET